MGRWKLERCRGEGGLSLVEVLASIVILTLLLTTFLMMFLQSAKVNKASEHVIDATYIAQEVMENIYALSTYTKHEARETTLISLGYTKEADELDENGVNWMVFKFKKEDSSNVSINIKLTTKKEQMDRVLVEVYEMPDGTLQAQMENVVVWEG